MTRDLNFRVADDNSRGCKYDGSGWFYQVSLVFTYVGVRAVLREGREGLNR
jgi:hypothetical protein